MCGVLPSYIGVGADAWIKGYLLLKGNDVIIRNLNIAKIPGIRNRFGDSTDGKLGNWNSEFDGLAV